MVFTILYPAGMSPYRPLLVLLRFLFYVSLFKYRSRLRLAAAVPQSLVAKVLPFFRKRVQRYTLSAKHARESGFFFEFSIDN